MSAEVTQQVAESEAAAEAIQPSAETKTWRFEGPDAAGNDVARDYIQEELSFFNKQEFINLLTKYTDQFVTGELGVSLSELFGGDLRSRVNIPTELSAEQAESMVTENIELIKAIIKIIQTIPGLQHDIFLLSLGVPRNERDWAKEVMTGPLSRGGLNDEDGFAILKTFISQNAGPIRTFFAERGRDLVDHFQEEVAPASEETEEEEVEAEVEETKEEQPEVITTPGGTPSSTSSADTQD